MERRSTWRIWSWRASRSTPAPLKQEILPLQVAKKSQWDPFKANIRKPSKTACVIRSSAYHGSMSEYFLFMRTKHWELQCLCYADIRLNRVCLKGTLLYFYCSGWGTFVQKYYCWSLAKAYATMRIYLIWVNYYPRARVCCPRNMKLFRLKSAHRNISGVYS